MMEKMTCIYTKLILIFMKNVTFENLFILSKRKYISILHKVHVI